MSAAPDDGARWADELRLEQDEPRVDRHDTRWMDDNPDQMGVPLTWADDYPATKAPETVIDGLLERSTVAVCFGEPNTGKSTFVLDMALAVARGEPWRGRRTRRGVVLWLALESSAGLRRRVAAYRQHHGLTDPARLPFGDITQSLRLLDAGHVQALLTTIHTAKLIRREECVLVVIDTLARALAGGDENDGRDMSRLISSCDQIRTQTGAAVLLVHHSGKDSTRGARGHSSLRAAVDTEIEVTGQANPRQARVSKQRDLPSGDRFAFNLEPVEVARDPETLEAITASVVVHREDVAPRRKEPNGRNQQLLLGAVRERLRATGSEIIAAPDLREIAKAQGLKDRRRLGEAREGLERDGWIVPCTGGHRYGGDKL